MARYTVDLRTDLADYLADTLRHNDRGGLDRWPGAAGGRQIVALTGRQVRYLETALTAEDDGHIDSDGNMWIGGTDYPVEIVHNA